MTRKDITQVFDLAGLNIPEWLDRRTADPAYDWEQGWCCGYDAALWGEADDEVLVRTYCRRDRLSATQRWLCASKGVRRLPDVPIHECFVVPYSDGALVE